MSFDLKVGATPYDDVFRTLIAECPELVLPLVSEMFRSTAYLEAPYDGTEELVSYGNEQFLNRRGGSQDRRVTDSYFGIRPEKGAEAKYHLECQSTPDGSMVVRMFEYDAQIAVRDRTVEGDRLTVRLPRSGVLYLRTQGGRRRQFEVCLASPGGSVLYAVPVMQMADYTLPEVFEKRLYFLAPFYVFNLEGGFDRAERRPEVLRGLRETYASIAGELRRAAEAGLICERTQRILIEMCRKVLGAITRNHELVREEAEKIMGGQVLVSEAAVEYDRAYGKGYSDGKKAGAAKGIEEGRAKGKTEGSLHQMVQMIDNARANPSLNWTEEEACAMLGVDWEAYKKAKAAVRGKQEAELHL